MSKGIRSLDWEAVHRVMEGRHHDPFEVLGLHPLEEQSRICAWLPDVYQAEVVMPSGKRFSMKRIHDSGFYEALVPRERPVQSRYMLHLVFHDGHEMTCHDPYSFPPLIGDFDLDLHMKGDHHRIFERLGAHPKVVDGVAGVLFALWAPHAERVSVVGNFNGWNGLRHPMRNRGASGIWELFLPGLANGEFYKYEIRSQGGIALKSDPYGRYMEVRPGTASIVWNLDDYVWNDASWLARRKEDNRQAVVSIYEVHLGSWMRDPQGKWLNYRELAHLLADYVLDLGFTHVELLPVSEHPLDASWGYQVSGYFAPTSRFGTPQDFMYLVDHLHQKNIGVIVDWVPGHFPKDAAGLAYFDGEPLYEYAHPDKREHRDWGTHIFDYGRNEVANFLMASALFWCEVYHIDGLRVDAVASMLYLDFSRPEGQWVPNIYGGRENLEAVGFLRRFNEWIHRYHPGVLTLAEESSSFPGVTVPVFAGGLGFDFKWAMGWMNDSLYYFEKDPVHRKYEHHKVTFFLIYAYSENYCLPISHDEVVHGKRSLLEKMPGDVWQKFAGIRSFLAYMWTMPGKKLLFMGQEFGQWQEWQHEHSLDWHLLKFPSHKGVQALVRDLNRLYKTQTALHSGDCIPGGFEWINADDSEQSIYIYIRKSLENPSDHLVVIVNATPVQREHFYIGVPTEGPYVEILNTDAEAYWGCGKVNADTLVAQPSFHQGRPFGLSVLLPALSVVVLKPVQ